MSNYPQVKYSSIYANDFQGSSEQVASDRYRSIFTYSKSNFLSSDRSGGFSADDIEARKRPLSATERFIVALLHLFVLLTLPLSLLFSLKMVQQTERLLVYRLGRLQSKPKGPGFVFVVPWLDRYMKIDVRTRAFSIPPKRVISSDGAEIEIGADVFYQIIDPIQLVTCLQTVEHVLRAKSQTNFLAYMSKQRLCELELQHKCAEDDIKMQINLQVQKYGVQIQRINISPIKVIQQAGALDSLIGCDSGINNLLAALSDSSSPNTSAAPRSSGDQHARLVSELARRFMPALFNQLASDSSIPAALNKTTAVANAETTSTVDVLIKRLCDQVRVSLSNSLVKQVATVYQFIITCDNTKRYFLLNLRDGDGSFVESETAMYEADNCVGDVVAVETSMEDMMRLLSNESSATSLYLSGRLTVYGDLERAKRLSALKLAA